jgi:predicted dehydrogenase
MQSDPIKTAAIGLTTDCLELLEMINSMEQYQLCAVSDRDPEKAEKIARKFDCGFYDDHRQLIISQQLELLIVADPGHLAAEHCRTAIKNGCNILKFPPPGINFDQAAEFIDAAAKNKVTFATIMPSRFSPACIAFNEHINKLKEQRKISEIYLITAVYAKAAPLNPFENRWMADPQLAGGGVILRNAYELIDHITESFSLPEQVYSLNTNLAPDKQQRLSITEDTAVITMKYSDTLMANIIASRSFGPEKEELTVYSKQGSCKLEENAFTIFDTAGEIIENHKFETEKNSTAVAMLEHFADAINPKSKIQPKTNELNTMAVIESAYLSTRTAMPEEPARILRMAPPNAANLWPPSSST